MSTEIIDVVTIVGGGITAEVLTSWLTQLTAAGYSAPGSSFYVTHGDSSLIFSSAEAACEYLCTFGGMTSVDFEPSDSWLDIRVSPLRVGGTLATELFVSLPRRALDAHLSHPEVLLKGLLDSIDAVGYTLILVNSESMISDATLERLVRDHVLVELPLAMLVPIDGEFSETVKRVAHYCGTRANTYGQSLVCTNLSLAPRLFESYRAAWIDNGVPWQ